MEKEKKHDDYFYKLNKNNQIFFLQGLYFGYPKCCIKAFLLKTNNLVEYDWNPDKKFHGLGFIPCKNCCKRNIENIVIKINQNRVHNIPFKINQTVESTIQINLIKKSNLFSDYDLSLFKKRFS